MEKDIKSRIEELLKELEAEPSYPLMERIKSELKELLALETP